MNREELRDEYQRLTRRNLINRHRQSKPVHSKQHHNYDSAKKHPQLAREHQRNIQEQRKHLADQRKITEQQNEIDRLKELRSQNRSQVDSRSVPRASSVNKSASSLSRSSKSSLQRSNTNISYSSATSHHKYNTYDERMRHISSKLLYSRPTPLSIEEMGPLRNYFNHYTRYKHDKDKSNEHSIRAKNDRFVYYYKNLTSSGHRSSNSFQVRFPKWFRPYARHLLMTLSGETSATIDNQPIRHVLMQLICLLDPVVDRRDMIADAMCNSQPHSTRTVKQGYRNIQKKLDDNQLRLHHNNTLKYMARDTHVMLDNQVNHLNRARSAKLYERERMLTHDKLLVIVIAQAFHKTIPNLMKDKNFWKVWGSSITDHAAYLLHKRTNAIGKSSHKRIGTNITNKARKGR